MPDALSKTIPIWLTVLNQYLFPTDQASHTLRIPTSVVSQSEYSQIAARIDGFVRQLEVGKIRMGVGID